MYHLDTAIDQVMTLRCPHCESAFDTFDACLLVHAVSLQQVLLRIVFYTFENHKRRFFKSGGEQSSLTELRSCSYSQRSAPLRAAKSTD
tara:strand:- start:1259 stop:1525 length:267 start_codon:yes stop_codon:yes gene_type:complete